MPSGFANPEDRLGNLNSPYTTSGGMYGRKIHYLPPGWGIGGLRRADGATRLGLGTWMVGGRTLPDLESSLTPHTLDQDCWGVPPPIKRSFPYGTGIPVFPLAKAPCKVPGGALLDIHSQYERDPSVINLPPIHLPAPLPASTSLSPPFGRSPQEAAAVDSAVERMIQVANNLAAAEPETDGEAPTPEEQDRGSESHRHISEDYMKDAKPVGKFKTSCPLLHVRGSKSEKHNADWTHKMRPGVRHDGVRKYRNMIRNPVDPYDMKIISNFSHWRANHSSRNLGAHASWKE
mmetsp:Transcript_9482/g.12864  ORF Transcript_9482/g.12864 Transcript_9482/m.12864 type:complete len:290 (-) Transcript_9482:158-1027(-)